MTHVDRWRRSWGASRRVAVTLRALWVGVVVVASACGDTTRRDVDPRDPLAAHRAAVRATPGAVDAWLAFSAACVRLAEDRLDLATATLADSLASVALSLDSTDVRPWNQLSRARLILRRFEDVLHLQTQALRRDVTNADAWGIQGDAFRELGRYRSADSCYYVMFHLEESVTSHVRLAQEAFLLRSFERTLDHIDDAFELMVEDSVSPGDRSSVHALFGEMSLAHGYIESAVAHAESALAYGPTSVRALELKARLLLVARRDAEAIRVLRTVLGLSEHPRYLSLLAGVEHRAGRGAVADSIVDVAMDRFEGLLAAAPRFARRDFVEFLLEWDREPQRALALAFEASRERKDPLTYGALAWAYYRNGRHDLAWSSISLALRRGVRLPLLFYRAAVIAKAAGMPERQAQFEQRIREAVPGFERIYGPL